MTAVSSSQPVLDSLGDPAVGYVVRVYRRDTGALIASGVTSDGTPQFTEAAWTPSADNPGWNGYTLRTVVPASALAAGSSVRVSISAGSADSAQVGSCYVGVQAASGDAYDFAVTPAQVLFGGSPGVTVSAGQTVESDAVAIDVAEGDDLVIAVYFSGPAVLRSRSTAADGWLSFYSSGDSAATVNASGYTTASSLYGTTRVRVYGDALPEGEFLINCGSYADEVNVVLLDPSGAPSLEDFIHRTTPV